MNSASSFPWLARLVGALAALSVVIPLVATASTQRDRDLTLLRPSWFWSGVPEGHSATVEDHARMFWYQPRDPVKERDLDPTLRQEEGGSEARTALELSIQPPVDDSIMGASDWAGIVQGVSDTGLDMSGLTAVEVWINDFHRDHTATHATLRIALGHFTEDAFWDAHHPPNFRLDTEDKNRDGRLDRIDPMDISYLPNDEDTGLDGLHDQEEPGYSPGDDPNGDDYRFNPNTPDYSHINNTEGNALDNPLARPDTEDRNQDGGLDIDEEYLEATVDLADSAFVQIDVPRDYRDYPVVGDQNGWRLFRIPMEAFQAVNAPDASSILHTILAARLVFDTIDHPLTLQIGGIRLDGVPAPPGSATILNQNRPNPFNPSTVITFELPQSSRVRLDVFDVAGRRVATVLDRVLDAGPQRAIWSARDDSGRPLASGVYFYRLRTPTAERTRRMVLVK